MYNLIFSLSLVKQRERLFLPSVLFCGACPKASASLSEYYILVFFIGALMTAAKANMLVKLKTVNLSTGLVSAN